MQQSCYLVRDSWHLKFGEAPFYCMRWNGDFHHHHHHHQHVPEGLGVFPVPWSSRWSWSLHLHLGRPMFLRPFGLYCSACFGSLFVSILCTCCSHFFWYCSISFTMFISFSIVCDRILKKYRRFVRTSWSPRMMGSFGLEGKGLLTRKWCRGTV